jgi:hypothetical protein
MALFFECTLQCPQKGLDAADIVRDSDITSTTRTRTGVEERPVAPHHIKDVICPLTLRHAERTILSVYFLASPRHNPHRD